MVNVAQPPISSCISQWNVAFYTSKCALTLHLPLPPGYVPTELDGHPERYPLQPPGLSFMSWSSSHLQHVLRIFLSSALKCWDRAVGFVHLPRWRSHPGDSLDSHECGWFPSIWICVCYAALDMLQRLYCSDTRLGAAESASKDPSSNQKVTGCGATANLMACMPRMPRMPRNRVPRKFPETNWSITDFLPLRSAHHVYIFGRPLQSHKES